MTLPFPFTVALTLIETELYDERETLGLPALTPPAAGRAGADLGPVRVFFGEEHDGASVSPPLPILRIDVR